jgi:hypothetical protein
LKAFETASFASYLTPPRRTSGGWGRAGNGEHAVCFASASAFLDNHKDVGILVAISFDGSMEKVLIIQLSRLGDVEQTLLPKNHKYVNNGCHLSLICQIGLQRDA